MGGLVGITSAAAIAAGGLKLFKDSLNAAAEAETGMVRLGASLRATGRDANISAEQISKIATGLMGLSTFDDEAIVNAFNSLTKFSSIKTGDMEKIVTVAMDMTAALGGDLAGNAESIGKLLESGLIPRTWGWSEALKTQVKTMIDAGDTGGALDLVMTKLNSQYGGQSAAQLSTYAGKVQVLKNNWGELLETAGGANLPAGKGFLDWTSKLIVTTNQFIQVEQGLTHEIYNTLPPLEKMVADYIALNAVLHGNLVPLANVLFKNIPHDIAATNTELDKFNGQLASTERLAAGGAVDLKDYGSQLSAMSDAAQSYTQYQEDAKPAMEALYAAQELVNQAMQDAKNVGWADYELKQAQQNFDALVLSEGDLGQATIDLTMAQENYDAAVGSSVGLAGAEAGLDSAQLAVEELQKAQQKATDQWVLNILTQELATNGLSVIEMKYLLDYQVNTGLITRDSASRASKLYEDTLKIADGINKIPAVKVVTPVWNKAKFEEDTTTITSDINDIPGEKTPKIGWGGKDGFDADAEGIKGKIGSIPGEKTPKIGWGGKDGFDADADGIKGKIGSIPGSKTTGMFWGGKDGFDGDAEGIKGKIGSIPGEKTTKIYWQGWDVFEPGAETIKGKIGSIPGEKTTKIYWQGWDVFEPGAETIKGKIGSIPGEKTTSIGWSGKSGFISDADDIKGKLNELNDVLIAITISGGCFVAKTPILMADDSYKSIEDIEIGEWVLSMDTETGEQINAEVREVFHHTANEMSGYVLINGTIGVTPEHRVFANSQWVGVAELRLGDCLMDANGNSVAVEKLERVAIRQPVYNLHTNHETHNYFAGGILVHNTKTTGSGAYGGDFFGGGGVMVGDAKDGHKTGYEEMVYALPGGGFRVVPNSSSQSAPAMAGGGVMGPNNTDLLDAIEQLNHNIVVRIPKAIRDAYQGVVK